MKLVQAANYISDGGEWITIKMAKPKGGLTK